MPAAARRYAKALLSLAQETGQEEAIGAELTHIAGVLAEPSLARALALPVTPYDPEDNYRRVRSKWWGVWISEPQR